MNSSISGPSMPQAPNPHEKVPSASAGASPQNQAGGDTGPNSPFGKLLGPTATPQEIKKAMDNFLNLVISQIKKDEQGAIAELKKMKKIFEGDDDS